MPNEPAFRAWLFRRHKRLALISGVAIPVGVLFVPLSPATAVIVSGLGLVGLVVAYRRLSKLTTGEYP